MRGGCRGLGGGAFDARADRASDDSSPDNPAPDNPAGPSRAHGRDAFILIRAIPEIIVREITPL